MTEEKEIMTVADLAEYLSFSKQWIYKRAQAGDVPGIRVGNEWRFKRSVIDKWLEEQINPPEVELTEG